ncbi:NAD(P)/FAD-dependent oxidoreductase [Nonomuraea sp. NPDC000554]|uniref:FAD-dependent oxidoreductase n=1 Tax=Nonomuraea sp. NPDC000554 TaxID=3154259 RepID=UPI0033298955
MHVMIIGAGIGGLCLAQRLRRDGVGVTVHERDTTPALRHQGYRLHLNADGQRALHHALPPDLWRLFLDTAGRPGPRSVFLDHHLGLQWVAESGEDLPPLAVDRLTLRRILLAGLDDVVRFGRRLTGYEVHDSGAVTARFADGTSATGDVLVAADGVNSVVRRQYLPHARVVDTGLRNLYGTIPLDGRTRELFSADMFNVFTAIVGPGNAFIGVAPVEFPTPVRAKGLLGEPTFPDTGRAEGLLGEPAFPDTGRAEKLLGEPAASASPGAAAVRSGAARDYMTCSFGTRAELLPVTDAELHRMSGEQLRAMVLDLVEGWHPRVRRIVSHWDPAGIFPAVLRTSVPVEPWPTTTVTLLGDAIHAMSPAGGIGANTALRDARALATALAEASRGRPLVPALRDYETAMTGYGFAAVRESAANGHRFLGQNPLPVP